MDKEIENKAKESYKEYSKDKCVDLYERYQYIDGFSEGYKQGQKDTFNTYNEEVNDMSNDYSYRLKKLQKENEELKAQIKIMKCCENCGYAGDTDGNGTMCELKGGYMDYGHVCDKWMCWERD